MRKISLVNQNGIPEALSNICFNTSGNSEELKLKLLDTNTMDDFLKEIRTFTRLNWKEVKETDDFVQVVYKDPLGNLKYLKGYKSQNKISAKKIKEAEILLSKFGVNESETSIVLDSICRKLFNINIYEEK